MARPKAHKSYFRGYKSDEAKGRPEEYRMPQRYKQMYEFQTAPALIALFEQSDLLYEYFAGLDAMQIADELIDNVPQVRGHRIDSIIRKASNAVKLVLKELEAAHDEA